MSLQGSNTIVAPLLNRDTLAADQGIYYTAISPTPGTGVVNTVNMTSLAIAEAAPFFHVYNGSPASAPVTVYPLYLRLTCTAANAASGGTLGLKFTFTVDQGNRVTTIPAAAGVCTINNVNMGSPNKSQSQIYGNAAALVTSAPTAQRRIVGHVSPRPTVLSVIGDVYQFNFGSTEQLDPSSLTPGGAGIANVTYGLGPVVLGQNQSFGVNVWAINNTTAPAFEIEFGFLEK